MDIRNIVILVLALILCVCFITDAIISYKLFKFLTEMAYISKIDWLNEKVQNNFYREVLGGNKELIEGQSKWLNRQQNELKVLRKK